MTWFAKRTDSTRVHKLVTTTEVVIETAPLDVS